VLRRSNRALSSLESALISLGGMIGAGLFVGSGTAIAVVGRSIVVSYLIAGLLILALLCLMAQMRRRMPAALLITDFVRARFGAVGGFIAGWIYWIFWTLVVTIEALAGGNILSPNGGTARLLAAIGVLTFTVGIGEKLSALLSELEVGFASLKVAVIVAFIVLTSFYVVKYHAYLPPLQRRADFSAMSVLAGVVIAFFSLAGVEIVHTIANSPTRSARESVGAIRLISIRIFGIYAVSLLLIVSVIRTDTIRPGFSPFTLTLESLDHPWAAHWLSALILIGIVTTLNAALAIGSRILDGLAGDECPSGRALETPIRAISPRWLMGAIALPALCAAAYWPAAAYAYLVKSASVVLVVVYILFALAADRLGCSPSIIGGAIGGAIGADRSRRWVGRTLAAALVVLLWAMAEIPTSKGPLWSALCLVALVAVAGIVTRLRPI
jgi:GABA permease